MADDRNDREQMIRERAYALWVEDGRPEGKSSVHWLEAEQALDAEEAVVTPLVDLGGDAGPLLVTPIR